jgi:hypothetical protein
MGNRRVQVMFYILLTIWLAFGTLFTVYGLFHLWQKNALIPRLDYIRAPVQILLWPMFVFMAIDVVVDDVAAKRKK